MILKLIELVLFFSCSLQAEEVIDLGSLEIQGELRRPSVRFYQTEKTSEDVVQEVAEKHFEDFEKKLLTQIIKVKVDSENVKDDK